MIVRGSAGVPATLIRAIARSPSLAAKTPQFLRKRLAVWMGSPFMAVPEMIRLLPRGKAVIIGGSHGGFDDKDALNELITTFLAAVSAPRTRAGSRPARPTGA